mgnify:CR=1 FL=1
MKKNPAVKPLVHRRFANRIFYWLNRCWLNDWSVSVQTTDEELPGESDGFHTLAEVKFLPAYKHATVTAKLNSLRELDQQRLDEVACHEVSHLLLGSIDVFVGQLTSQLPRGVAQRLVIANWEELKESTTSHLQRVLTAQDHKVQSRK